ncbi:MAG: dihydrofolate reductase [Patescibacteria group bacterium]
MAEKNAPRVSAIAAITKGDRGLGKGKDLLWKIPGDMARFKALTMGHAIVMGRKTFDSIGHTLPGRTNVVVTRDTNWSAPGATIAHSIEEALAFSRELEKEEIFVIGGGEVYKAALPYTNRLYLTVVDGKAEADAFFPEYEQAFTNVVSKEKGEHGGLAYKYVVLERA